jgi:predicted DsbA family dithiol-disulfide isomerase
VNSLPSSEPLRVFTYFDYACPYSYLAVALLGSAAEQAALDIVWRPLEIRPEVVAPQEGAAEGPGDDFAEADWQDLAERAAALGLPLYRPRRHPSTRLALQAGEFARDLGKEAHLRLHRAIFRAHFVRQLQIDRMETLSQLAAEEGLDVEALSLALEDGRYLEELRRAEEEAERYEIAQTPTMLFGRFKVVGAAPVEVLLKAARRSSAE